MDAKECAARIAERHPVTLRDAVNLLAPPEEGYDDVAMIKRAAAATGLRPDATVIWTRHAAYEVVKAVLPEATDGELQEAADAAFPT